MKDLARRLRRHGTDAERLLWNRLRGRQLAGIKFRHQQVLGPYIVDFLCLEPKLVIEIDGGQHVEQAHQNEVLSDPDAVVGSIRAALIEIPLTPRPLPKGEGATKNALPGGMSTVRLMAV